MPEQGARVRMPKVAEMVLRGLEYFTWPLDLDDYLELISPLWSTKELRGRIERVQAETPDAATIYITPGFRWRGHAPGQYLRIGFDIAGKRHWRAYSLSSDSSRPDGQITITVKQTPEGVVSRWLHGPQAVGSIVTLGDVEGEFVLDDPAPRKLLFITAGSGVTPVMAMLRALERRRSLGDTVHLHSARTPETAIFASELKAIEQHHDPYRLKLRITSQEGRLTPDALDTEVPDWRERVAYACGPGELLDALADHYEAEGIRDRLHVESFEHFVFGGSSGRGGEVKLMKSDLHFECDGSTPILVAGEGAGAELPFGCRMGICHTCTGRLLDGSVRDLRTGELTHAGTEIRTCVNCPDGPVVVDL